MPVRYRFQRVLSHLLLGLVLSAGVPLAGCARLPVVGPLPAGVSPVGSLAVHAGAPFAWSPDGTRIALVRDGLRLWAPASGENRKLASESPTAIGWSPDGGRIAAAFPRGDSTLVRILDPSGSIRGESSVEGNVRSLCWHPGGNLLFAATRLKHYSFGATFTLTLYRWDEKGSPQETVLHDVTLKPLTLHQWGGLLASTPGFSLSPLGDEIVYARLHDPPAFAPYLRLVVRHLESGSVKEVASLPLGVSPAVFAADGETLLYADADGVRSVEVWRDRQLADWPLPAPFIALSSGGRWLLAGDRLYRDGSEVARFDGLDGGVFAPGGGRLLLRSGGRLHLLAGVEDTPPSPVEPAQRERLLRLRGWRATGLLTPEEYLQQKQRIFAR